MTKKQKKMLTRILVAMGLAVLLILAEHLPVLGNLEPSWLRTGIIVALAVASYLVAGYDILVHAFKNIGNGQVFDEDFLMMIATFGAFAIGEYLEAAAVMIFFQIGELFQSYAVGKSRESIAAMMEIAPEFANVERDGELEEVDPEDVRIDDIIVIRPGEKVPLDGVVIEGTSFLDTSSMTGESVPRSVKMGDSVISGCVNQNGTLKVRVEKLYEDSTVARVLELVENASSRKAKVENFITRFARYYTPVVTVGAVLLAIIPPVFFGQNWMDWLERACTFLVISCPCALVISVPLGFFGGIGSASKIGVLVKGSNYLETLSKADIFVFDKTGTLTKGEFKVTEVVPQVTAGSQDQARKALLEAAAHLECYSTHPIAAALRTCFSGKVNEARVSDIEEIPGHGIVGTFDGSVWYAGNRKLMTLKKVEADVPEKVPGTVVFLARVLKDQPEFMGYIVIDDTPKEGAREAIESLKAMGRQTVMLTGDRAGAAEHMAQVLGVDRFYADLLPGDKVAQVEALMQNSKTGAKAEAGSDADKKTKVCFVGDGINDAPVLTRADVGIAMGSLGSDAAIEAADIVIMDDDIRKIAKTVKISKKTLGIVHQNIVGSLAVKFAVLILAAFGFANMWLGMVADVGVCVVAILNSMRALYLAKD